MTNLAHFTLYNLYILSPMPPSLNIILEVCISIVLIYLLKYIYTKRLDEHACILNHVIIC